MVEPVPAIDAKGVLKYTLARTHEITPFAAKRIGPAIATGIGTVQWAVEEVAVAVITLTGSRIKPRIVAFIRVLDARSGDLSVEVILLSVDR